MTIESSDNKSVYFGDGVLSDFPYGYRMDDDSDMEVYLGDDLQGAGYVVARNPDNVGGTVTITPPPADGVIVTLLRVLELTQETDYVQYDAFPAESHEKALDKLTMLAQQQQEQITRNTQAIGEEDGVDTTAPPFLANRAWKWGNDGNKKLINSTYDPDEQATIALNAANNAVASKTESQLSAWESEAEQQTSDNFANTEEDTNVDIVTSNGDGTFTSTPSIHFSSFHWSKKSEAASASGEANTSSNSGSGEGLVLAKVGVNLPFKSLKVSGAMGISSDADSVTFTTPVGVTSHTQLTNIGTKTHIELESEKANLLAPAFSGTPTAPTALAGTNTAQLATCAFVRAEPSVIGTDSVDTPALVDEAVTPAKVDIRAMQVALLMPTVVCTFDGTLSGTNSPISGVNVTSVTRIATGRYQINFITAMDVLSYSITTLSNYFSTQNTAAKLLNSCEVRANDGSFVLQDANEMSVHIFGGLE